MRASPRRRDTVLEAEVALTALVAELVGVEASQDGGLTV